MVTLISLITSSCEFSAKENYFGNNIYLSEYDCKYRRILYQKTKQSTSGVEIVPMTVSEVDYNNQWIIAKSNKSEYWIIKNKFNKTPTSDEVKKNVIGPLNKIEFENQLSSNRIKLSLKKIKC